MCKKLLSWMLIVVICTVSYAQIISANSYEDVPDAEECSETESNSIQEKTESDELFQDAAFGFEDDENYFVDETLDPDKNTIVESMDEPVPIPEIEDESVINNVPEIIEVCPELKNFDIGSEESLPETEVQTESEPLVGSSAYQLQIRWLDGGTRMFDLGSVQSISNAAQSATDLLTKIGLNERCNIYYSGSNVVAAVKNTSKSQGSPTVVAHAGYVKSAPENTLSSIRMAAAYGFTDVEFDVRFTKDKIPVLCHDATINLYARNPDGSVILPSIYIKDYTYEELQKYDFGIRRGTVWKGEKIPTLEDALSICQKSGLRPNLDIKGESNMTNDMLGTIYSLVEQYGFHSNVNYMSYLIGHLKYFIERDPNAMYTLIVYDANKDFIQNADRLKELVHDHACVYIHSWQLTESIARTLRFHNIRLSSAPQTRSQIANLDKWVNYIIVSRIEPNTVRSEAAKRNAYTVSPYNGSIRIGKDYGFYPLMNCGVHMHMLASRVGRPVAISTDTSIAEMNAFRFKQAPNGRYYILSTRCMFALASDASGKVILKEPSKTDISTQWDIISNSNKTYSFVNASTGGFLAISSISSGSSLVVSSNAQIIRTQFFLALSPKQISIRFEDGRFSIRPFLSEKYAMGVKGGSCAEKANVHLTTRNKSYKAQHFYFIYSGDGYFRIKNEHSGKCLEMKNGYVVQTAWDNKSAQRWKIAWQGGSVYTIECKTGGKMNVMNSKLAAKTLINKATVFKGNPYQKWYLRYD